MKGYEEIKEELRKHKAYYRESSAKTRILQGLAEQEEWEILTQLNQENVINDEDLTDIYLWKEDKEYYRANDPYKTSNTQEKYGFDKPYLNKHQFYRRTKRSDRKEWNISDLSKGELLEAKNHGHEEATSYLSEEE
ncbi:hypothetical protein U472_03260 [Orenia metallireducens]|uniref:Uncharacterized protein n=1 Tax=Orenia metallireducens TaxID=1413210 RepID=A0A1C0AB47_9FIRM|nr:hypothetical protein [Orenia metallireducens]OCL27586.1 hypothetical protein U472_03260 [Orenia metallireducens]